MVATGQLWFRLFARPRKRYWDTTKERNGSYELTVRAWDLIGNSAGALVDVTIAN